jgi:hypothetical protein
MTRVVIDDGRFFPVGQPVIARHQAVVFIRLAIALAPVVELAAADAQPGDQRLVRQFRSRVPVANVVDDFIARVVGNPTSC